jgi:hypothetical protein
MASANRNPNRVYKQSRPREWHIPPMLPLPLITYARTEPPPCVCGHVWRNHAPWGCWSCANRNRECERYEEAIKDD